MFHRFKRNPYPFEIKPRLSIPDVCEKITEQKNEHKEESAVCPITMLAPFFPLQSIDSRHQQTYDGFGMLSHIDSYGSSPWNPSEKVTLQTVGSKYKSNQEQMTAFNQVLAQEGYTQDELLAYYKISPELFRYLIALDFHSALEKVTTSMDQINAFMGDHTLQISLLICTASVYLYYEMFLSEICLSNLAINQSAYDLIYEKIMEVHENFPNNTFGPAYCEKMGYANVSNMRMDGFNGSLIGLENNATYFAIITAQMQKANVFAAARALLCGLLTAGYFCGEMLQGQENDGQVKSIFVMFLLAIITASAFKAFYMRDSYDHLLSLLSHSTETNTVARACNDGFLRPHLTNQTVPPALSPAFELPACTTPWLNITTASFSLVAGPVSFFGARVARACWKKLNPPRLSVEEQFNALRENKFNISGKG